jgi:hypothetical protein
MKKTVFILAILSGALFAGEKDTTGSERNYKLSVGAGLGIEGGNGVHLGILMDKHSLETGIGILYNGDDASLDYSIGLRYFRSLFSGRINDTYVWTGAGFVGGYEDGYNTYLASYGFGFGVSYHFGLPFHFNLDSGANIMYNNGMVMYVEKAGFHIMPAINGSITYQW